jgi:tRNA-dihydrouridine synthase
MGYEEVNLNLGCPSGTVFSKGRGSGMLAYPEKLEAFLDDIFMALDMPVTIKTRLGVTDPEEFYDLLEIYNRFPAKKLIIHPRVRAEFYKKIPHLDMYAHAVKESKIPLCYNGNIFSLSGYEQFMKRFPDTQEIMLGRGLLANPGLVGEIRGEEPEDGKRMKAFLDELLIAYEANCPGEKPLLFKLKEQWYYMASLFPDHQRLVKKIRKAQHVSEYREMVDQLFDQATPETTYGFYFA